MKSLISCRESNLFKEDTESMKCEQTSPKEFPDELDCGHCHQKFKLRSSLYQHYSRTHYEKEMRIFLDEESDNCKFCGILIRKPKDMIAHIGSVHDKVEDFSCDVCSKSFATKQELDVHKLQHSGVKPHSCPSCAYTCMY